METTKPVGIIANPASGKDIRRLVAYGSVFDTQEKINIIRRLLMSLDAMGIPNVYIMPDPSGLAHRAMDNVEVSLQVDILEMPVDGDQDDSSRAARIMNEMGIGCIVTLGGDGTNRVIAKKCGKTPLMPISSGTNNVFPHMVEGTLAGIAAGLVAQGSLPLEETCDRMPRLELFRNGKLEDIALVDLVSVEAGQIGSRAIWDASTVRDIFLTRALPHDIGFSAVGGYISPLPVNSGQALYVSIGEGRHHVKVPIAPGLIREMPISSHRRFGPAEALPISASADVISLDGEREVVVRQGDEMTVRLSMDGPLVVNMERTLARAVENGEFLTEQVRQAS